MLAHDYSIKLEQPFSIAMSDERAVYFIDRQTGDEFTYAVHSQVAEIGRPDNAVYANNLSDELELLRAEQAARCHPDVAFVRVAYASRELSNIWSQHEIKAIEIEGDLRPNVLSFLLSATGKASNIACTSNWRTNVAAGLLRDSAYSVAEVAERVGYSADGLRTAFKDLAGVTPKTYRVRESLT